MNMTQVRVIVQYLTTAAASYVAGRGYLPADTANELAVWVAAGVPLLISVWKSRDCGKIATAAKIEGVTVVAPENIANNVPAANVISSALNMVISKT